MEIEDLHQTYSYLQNVVLNGEVGEAVPELFGASLDVLPSAHQALTAFVEVKLRHLGDVL